MSDFEASHTVRLHEPQVEQTEVHFSWSVTPETELYERCEFTLSFPAGVELRRLPRSLWWRAALMCLHPHWAMLRPCRVVLPVDLGAGEREFWRRLIENLAAQREAYGAAPLAGPSIEIADGGPPAEPRLIPGLAGERAAVSFSGGKDSLALTALLAELTVRPLLVISTSPVPWAIDHSGWAREELQRQIVKRLPVELMEVRSDFRTCWENNFSHRDGCRFSVHEMSDLPLFQTATMVAAATSGIGRMFMASEADIQYNGARGAGVVLHPEFASCAVTQSALDALLRRFGMRQGSLNYPLHMPQVQALLLRRYPGLCDIQLSCWQAPDGTWACSSCAKCFQIALVALAEGFDPRLLGIDGVSVLCAFGDWPLDAPTKHGQPSLHEFRVARHHIMRCLQQTPSAKVAVLLAGGSAPADPRLGEALAVYARMRAEAMAMDVPAAPGYIGGFLELVPGDLRGRLQAIFDQYFEPAPAAEFGAVLSRSRELADWIAEPLRRPPSAAGATGHERPIRKWS
jgi:hypothetical protein